MKTLLPIIPFTLVLAAALLSGCGKAENKAGPSAPAIELAAGERLIEITGDDTMKFNVTEIRAKAGEKLVVSLKNIGSIPKPAMAHNWVLFKAISDADVGALCAAAATKPPEYLPADTSAVLAHTKMVGSGESDHVKVTVPTEPGAYPYVCTFPGHFMLMRGKLIVN